MTSRNTNGDYDSVLYTKVMTNGLDEDNDMSDEEEVVIEKKSLISDNKLLNEMPRSSRNNYCCVNRRITTYILFIFGAMLFIAGFIIGLLIGGLIHNFNQSEDSKIKHPMMSHNSSCNCSFNSPHIILSTTEDSKDVVNVTPEKTTRKTTTHSTVVTQTHSSTVTKSCKSCKSRNPFESGVHDPSASLFAPMTTNEMKAVSIAMITKNYVSNDPKFGDDRLSHMYLYPVIKAEALNHLDKKMPFPGRFAKVHVYRPTHDPPDVMEYKVGPLNVSFQDMTVKKLLNDGDVHFNRRPYDVLESSKLYEKIKVEIKAIASLLYESFDGMNVSKDTSQELSYQPTLDINDRTSGMVLVSNTGRPDTLRLLPVSCTIQTSGDWFPFQKTASDMQEAFDQMILRKIHFPKMHRESHKGDFLRVRNTSLPSRDLSDIPPPRTYEPEGPRIFKKGGNALRNYQLSQDITLLYSSQTNGHGPPVLSDTFFLIGDYNRPIYDVDCPKRSSILNATTFFAGSPIDMNAICVFEADGQRPLWRHGSRGLADHYLVVRAPISVGNYDYVFEWNFHLDGRLKTKLTASGYLFGAFYDPDDPMVAVDKSFTPFGYRLAEYLLGPIHDHTFSFKIDLDIFGTKNSFETVKWKAGSTTDAFRSESNISRKPGYILFNQTRYVNSEILKHENSFILDTKNPKVWAVVNENKINAWGAKKGYRVIPHSKYAENFDSHMMLHVWDHLKYQLAVTKRKESEQYSTNSLYVITHPLTMQQGSNVMKLDDDPVQNEDIVLWISEKFYHLPTSEDVPMTLPAEAGFTLKPFNYFDRTPVFDLPARYSKTDPYENIPCFVTD
ncbi:retina-specific copper amine oxidase-like [Ruditapes philippinarum]|uniref:retina-specific copper amine oxidase-like n=1 Tax=Ruditapes philippinarum TaxID=129788 RepID=UPI00295A8AF4|nr:retina-specific copper amine oxidase-like [Ruditapes philippinarum]